MQLLGIDIGTTHCKVGLFALDGTLLARAVRPTPARRSSDGAQFYDPDQLWQTLVSALAEVTSQADAIAALGIASMAETGLLVERRSGRPASPLIPWYDTAALAQARQLRSAADPYERFCATGLRPSFKYGLVKLLRLRSEQPGALAGAVWLSAADYVAYRLTGVLATDYTLAARTYAFRIDTRTWDEPWIRSLGLDPDLFPVALASGTPSGEVTAEAGRATGLVAGTPVAIAGHDHLCAALAVGAIEPGLVLDSMGTAESLVGTLEELRLGREAHASGLSFGCHVVAGRYVWVGGLATSGGSLEWLGRQLAGRRLSYSELEELLAATGAGPGDIFYFPYLAGSGAPLPDPSVRGALLGLHLSHGPADLVKAVLEGIAYEIEAMRRTAEQFSGVPITALIAVGGGARHGGWLQIKADISGCTIAAPALEEATALGAALVAGIGCRLYSDAQAATAALAQRQIARTVPDPARHQAYRQAYEHGYCRLQRSLRAHSSRYEEQLGRATADIAAQSSSPRERGERGGAAC